MIYIILLFFDRSLIFTPKYQIFTPIQSVLSLLFPLNWSRAILQRLIPSVFHMWRVRYTISKGREGNTRLGRRWKSFARVCAKLFWIVIYCSNLRPEPNSQSGSLSHRGMGSQYPLIMCYCGCATAILIQMLIHPHTCKMGSSIFAAMIWLKFVSTNRASLPSIR